MPLAAARASAPSYVRSLESRMSASVACSHEPSDAEMMSGLRPAFVSGAVSEQHVDGVRPRLVDVDGLELGSAASSTSRSSVDSPPGASGP